MKLSCLFDSDTFQNYIHKYLILQGIVFHSYISIVNLMNTVSCVVGSFVFVP